MIKWEISIAKNKCAFTLAEVLITLGIIGVVAAMTLPALIQTQKNIEVESKLKKVYSVMNQAILMSEVDNGPKEYWDYDLANKPFFEKYFLPYLSGTSGNDFQSFGGNNIIFYFNDGSALVVKKDSRGAFDFFFFPNAKNFDKDTFSTMNDDGSLKSREGSGISYFAFAFYTIHANQKYHYKKGFEPYKVHLANLSKEELTGSHNFACKKNSMSRSYCTALIQLNGWKIPKDYPFKVK